MLPPDTDITALAFCGIPTLLVFCDTGVLPPLATPLTVCHARYQYIVQPISPSPPSLSLNE
jgi:hypothetical protein